MISNAAPMIYSYSPFVVVGFFAAGTLRIWDWSKRRNFQSSDTKIPLSLGTWHLVFGSLWLALWMCFCNMHPECRVTQPDDQQANIGEPKLDVSVLMM